MGTTRVRLTVFGAELMGTGAIALLTMAMVYRMESGIFALLGIACLIACATMAVAATVMCATTKLMQAMLRQTMAEQAAEYLRRHEL